MKSFLLGYGTDVHPDPNHGDCGAHGSNNVLNFQTNLPRQCSLPGSAYEFECSKDNKGAKYHCALHSSMISSSFRFTDNSENILGHYKVYEKSLPFYCRIIFYYPCEQSLTCSWNSVADAVVILVPIRISNTIQATVKHVETAFHCWYYRGSSKTTELVGTKGIVWELCIHTAHLGEDYPVQC